MQLSSPLPPQIQAVLPILQGLNDKQRLSLIEWLASQKSKESPKTNQTHWQEFIDKRNELLKTQNVEHFLVDRNQSKPQVRTHWQKI